MLTKETVYLDGFNNVMIEVLDARSVRLTFNAKPLDIKYDGRKVTGIYISGKAYLTLNEFNIVYVNIGSKIHNYTINSIEKLNENCFLAHTVKRTKASFFLTPLIGDSREDFRWKQYFINSYLTSENKLLILFRFFNLEDYKQFEHSLKKHKMFAGMGDHNTDYVMFTFKLPEESLDIISKFKEGKYSKMSDSYKEKILKFHGLDKSTELGKVLFKSDERRKQLELELAVKIPIDIELYDKPDEGEIIKI